MPKTDFPTAEFRISLLTAGKDPHYALGLVSGLIPQGVSVDFIGNDEMSNSDVVKNPQVTYYNLRGDQRPTASYGEKLTRVLFYYFRLLRYAARSESTLFHILWLNKFTFFDSTALNLYYKALGKKLVFTAHNIDIEERDEGGGAFHRFALRFLYRVVDHIFVHTEKMKRQLVERYGVQGTAVTVIPFGVNTMMPSTTLTRDEARAMLGLGTNEKVVLFFGNIAPYKGLEYLVSALGILHRDGVECKLVIAGRVKFADGYWRSIRDQIDKELLAGSVLTEIDYIPDERVEVFFKAADIVAIPYKTIFQSGVLFLSYNFGLPVLATDVGSLREDIVDGRTGFICRPEDPVDLADKLRSFFRSDLFNQNESARRHIIEYANDRYSWEKIGKRTREVYENLMNERNG